MTLDLGWIDLFMLAVMVASVIIGLWRGFIFEVLMLVGWIAGYFFAQWFAPELAPRLPIGAPGSGINHAAAFALCFVLALIVWSLLAKLVRLVLRATPLSLPDRVLGAGFGVLRGGVLLVALATIVAFTPAAQSPMWQASIGARWLDATVSALKPALPPDIAHWLSAPRR